MNDEGQGGDFAAFEQSHAESEKPETEEVQTNEAEGEEQQGDDEAETGENGTGEADGEQQGDKPKGKTVQQRIDELTAKAREAERREAEARAELERLKKPEAKAEEGDKPKDGPPDPNDYEFGEVDVKFITDTARYEARQEYARQAEEGRVVEAISKLDAKWETNKAAAAERYPDFDDKVTASASRGEWPCPLPVSLAIKDSEVGADVAYHLATHVDEAKALAGMHPLEQARAFGRLEARFLNREQGERKTTSAPPPPDNRVRGAGGKFAVSADTPDFAAFERAEKARQGV